MTRRPQIVAAVALVVLALVAVNHLGIDVRDFAVALAQDCWDVLKLMFNFFVDLFKRT
ncbi:MAG TPA: hypothetical protein VD837_10815 [Terriglobales bacterium]|nr:hypothetical protein [Terriglobales bacterium]